jgi:hypothetical protein
MTFVSAKTGNQIFSGTSWMIHGRHVEISESSWYEVGKSLAEVVHKRSSFAYIYDREIYRDEQDIQKIWKENLALTAETSMKSATPLAFDLCSGFNTVFKTKGEGFSVWELLTLYEVDMFLHEFHYKCRYCLSRIMEAPRYICPGCSQRVEADDARERKKKMESVSVCRQCSMQHPECPDCKDTPQLVPTSILHETSGLGIANKSGCTGFAYRSNDSHFCGQTLEMATDTYNFGRFDTIYKLTNSTTKVSVLVYDVGCILSPFGLNSKGFALCVFNLYNSDYSLPPYDLADIRVPMASLQWELLLRGTKTVGEGVTFLRSLDSKKFTFTSASFIMAADGDVNVIEITANNHWIPEMANPELFDDHPSTILIGKDGTKWIARANNCLAGSCLHSSESLPPNISSKQRQSDLHTSFQELVEEPTIEWAKNAMSTPTIQTDYCLGTIVMDPKSKIMHVRFRVGTRISTTLKNGGKWESFSI